MNINLIVDDNSVDLRTDENALDLSIDSQIVAGSDYDTLTNKPKINGVILQGNRDSAELGLQDEIGDITEQDIDNMIYGGI